MGWNHNILPHVPIWAQRGKGEINEARRQCLTFCQDLHTRKSSCYSNVQSIIIYAGRNFVETRKAATFFYFLRTFAQSASFTPEEVDEAQHLFLTGLANGRFRLEDKKAAPATDEEFEDADEDLSGEEAVDDEDQVRITSELLADLGAELCEDELQAAAGNYPAHLWQEEQPEVQPGFRGFNSRAIAVMRKAHVGTDCGEAWQSSPGCPQLQPHQDVVAFLLHPRSPVMRLLVDHPTGSGKTREMIRVLDNFFYDPRPKVPIFPKAAVCRNFYMELLRWPSRYRDYFCCERPGAAEVACGELDWRARRIHMWDMNRLPEATVRDLCRSLREVLEMKGMFFRGMMRRSCRATFRKKHPGEPMPFAPLRAISYASAGGCFSAIVGSQPKSAVMKIGYELFSGNVYTNKVVLLDEVHNLVRTQTQYSEQLHRLRRLLVSSHDLVLACFTGTPILSERAEGRHLLSIVKGQGAFVCDEGFLSSFSARPRPHFPLALPHGIPDGLLTPQRLQQLVKPVELHGEALNVYDLKRQQGLTGTRLRNYCNVCAYVSSFHEGRSGTKARILACPEECCPKLHAVALAVASSMEKALVITGRCSGYLVMLELLRQVAERSNPPFRVAGIDELADFNHVSNLRGELYRVLVADASQCSEGISFLAVRRVHLTDVPALHSQFVQQCGRAVRMFGHRGLPDSEQQVIMQLYVATLPVWMAVSLGCWAFRAQRRQKSGKSAEQVGRLLLSRLEQAGITTLDEWKSQVDILKPAAASSDDDNLKTQVPSKVITEFLQKFGLLELPEEADSGFHEHCDRSVARNTSLVQAVQALGAAGASCESLALCPRTADEEGLQQLAGQAREVVSALTSLRAVAIDRDLFRTTGSSIIENTISSTSNQAESSIVQVDVSLDRGGPPRKRVRLRRKTVPTFT